MPNTINRYQLEELKYADVTIKDAVLQNAFSLELAYLNSLSADKLLAGFLETAGLEPKAEKYPGWESSEIQGHTLGHFLTALSQAYGEDGDSLIKEKIDYILKELLRSQSESGYLFASGKELFDKVENNKPVWVPWYTMHKILSGIIAAYVHTNSKTAYEVMCSLGNWVHRRCTAWNKEMQKTVLRVEYGGMNDCLYDLYLITGEDKYAKAAHCFDEIALLEAFCEYKDVLNGLHANTTIPKVIGFAKRFAAFGEAPYLQAAENFWDLVIHHHTYITGGNSEWEHFGEPDVLSAERTACNCETCNTYNMLKLSKLLFRLTKDKKYADYYEWAMMNAILSSQNPETGMTTYFQPMATGYFKVFGTPYDRFWCCTGSGMENFTKLTEGIYFYHENRIYINQYVSSAVNWKMQGVSLELTANLQKEESVMIKVNHRKVNTAQYSIALRQPEWLGGQMEIHCCAENFTVFQEDGYLILTANWKTGDEITVSLPMKLQVHTLPDQENVTAFSYGPFVLSADLGTQRMNTTVTGIDVLVPMKEFFIKDYITLSDTAVCDRKKDIGNCLTKKEKELVFVLENEDMEPLVFSPHFARYKDRYGIYWTFFQKGSEELNHYIKEIKRKQALHKSQIDIIPVGNDQYELAHRIKGIKTDTTHVEGHPCRFAIENGWFSYDLALNPLAEKLCVTYCNEDAGNSFSIILNESYQIHETVSDHHGNHFYKEEYEIPSYFLTGNSSITVKFQNINPEYTCRIFDELYITKK